ARHGDLAGPRLHEAGARRPRGASGTSPGENPLMSALADPSDKRPPTYVGIIVFKLIKGTLFLILAIVAYTLSDNNLPEDYRRLVESMQPLLDLLRVHPGNKFF